MAWVCMKSEMRRNINLEKRSKGEVAGSLLLDEWVVCRIFMKSSGGKKYPSNQPRANPYNFEMGTMVMPSLMHLDPHHFGFGRNYLSNAELTELSRLARGTPSMNLPFQPLLSFPSSFAHPGLNLNLGAPHQHQHQHQHQPVLQAMTVPLAQSPMATEPPPSMLTNCIMAADAGLNAVPPTNGGARFHNVDSCMDLEGYWPTY